MNQPISSSTNRREFIKTSGRIAAASALTGAVIPRVHAASGDTVQLAIVGCGGRGTGAVMNALNTATLGPIKLVAMADAFENKLKGSHGALSKNKKVNTMVEVPEEKQFLGFDAYKKAMDCLKPGDVVILATPPAFRWVHFQYAIEKKLNVFMEKPVTVDGPTSKRMLALGEEASKKNLKVGVGLMSRHNKALQELARRIHGGEIGEVILMRAYRMHGPIGFFSSLPKPEGISELRYQVQRFHSFLWASGGNYSDFYIHLIDNCCWMKNAWPVSAQALGGRHYRKSPDGIEYIDQNLDTYSVEYTFEDGTKLFFDGRCMNGCENIYNSYIHGSKGSAIGSKHGDCGLPSSIYKGQKPNAEELVWESKVAKEEQSPYDNEWMDLIAAIRENKPYNEVERGVKASLVTSLGRMAAHTGQVITYDQILNGEHEFAPGLDKLTEDSPAPLQAGPDGKYPVPMPGINRKREYGADPKPAA
jgi:predicted dehydrogenase